MRFRSGRRHRKSRACWSIPWVATCSRPPVWGISGDCDRIAGQRIRTVFRDGRRPWLGKAPPVWAIIAVLAATRGVAARSQPMTRYSGSTRPLLLILLLVFVLVG